MRADMFGTAVIVAVSIEKCLIRTYFLAIMFDTTLLLGPINGKMFGPEFVEASEKVEISDEMREAAKKLSIL